MSFTLGNVYKSMTPGKSTEKGVTKTVWNDHHTGNVYKTVTALIFTEKAWQVRYGISLHFGKIHWKGKPNKVL